MGLWAHQMEDEWWGHVGVFQIQETHIPHLPGNIITEYTIYTGDSIRFLILRFMKNNASSDQAMENGHALYSCRVCEGSVEVLVYIIYSGA